MKILLTLTTSDWIEIFNILLTSVIGIWIGISVQKNLTTNRAVKDYFIKENRDIKEKYNKFINDLYSNNLSSEYIKNWFQVMTRRLNTFEGFLTNEYIIKPETLIIHNNLKYKITGSEDFNNHYKKDSIKFSENTKNDILDFHSNLSNSLTKLVIDTNRANRKYFCRKKYGQNNTEEGVQ